MSANLHATATQSADRGRDAARSQGRSPERDRRTVAIWLFICCAAVLAMIVIGGITRLTESGLSITVWQPLVGTIPPLSVEDWEELFALYRQTSEYQLVNAWMTLDDFKTIFWWEYIHRLWGRLIGLLFIVPLAVFAWRGMLDRRLGLKLLAIFALGGLQGAIGWWMVTSGLVDRTTVSPYRLTIHLGLAFLLFALMLWMALGLVDRARAQQPAPPALRWFGWLVVGVVCVTVAAGAFVAGNRAGLIYNTFPLMDGQLIPPDYAAMPSMLHNTFENPAAVQFHHRVLAILTLLVVCRFRWRLRDPATPAAVLPAANALVAAVALQVITGIATLLLVVPIPLAAVHQGGSVVVLGCAIWTLYRLQAPARVYA